MRGMMSLTPTPLSRAENLMAMGYEQVRTDLLIGKLGTQVFETHTALESEPPRVH